MANDGQLEEVEDREASHIDVSGIENTVQDQQEPQDFYIHVIKYLSNLAQIMQT